MKKIIFLSIFILSSHFTFAVPLSMYISANPVNCTVYAYEIELTYFGEPVSILAISGPINFGDGTYDDFYLDENYDYLELAGRKTRKYKFTHTFPGAGVYKVQLRSFNRDIKIANMTNSINTPYFIETQIVIDPYLGCNSTPKMETMLFHQKTGDDYHHNFSFHDAENDSLSYQLRIPHQDDTIAVGDYWFPMDLDQLNHPISRISLDQLNGTVSLNGANLSGNYTAALEVNEWRKVEGLFYKISRTVFDFNLSFSDTENNLPIISSVKDTAIVVGAETNIKINAIDPDNNPILLRLYGDLFQLLNISVDNSIEFRPGFIEKMVSFKPNDENIRANPFKLISSVMDNNPNGFNLDVSQTNYIWIADKSHQPAAIEYFTAKEIGQEVIELEWIDVDNELGYIIERSDKYFPKFLKLAVLPKDAISFYDSSTVRGNSYEYRIKAVGTSMSAYKSTSINTTNTITSSAEIPKTPYINIYPNPSNGAFWITSSKHVDALQIIEASGKIVWDNTFLITSSLSDNFRVKTGLPRGIYIVNALISKGIISRKLLIY